MNKRRYQNTPYVRIANLNHGHWSSCTSVPVVFIGVWMTPLVISNCGNLENPIHALSDQFTRFTPSWEVATSLMYDPPTPDVTQTVGPAARRIEKCKTIYHKRSLRPGWPRASFPVPNNHPFLWN